MIHDTFIWYVLKRLLLLLGLSGLLSAVLRPIVLGEDGYRKTEEPLVQYKLELLDSILVDRDVLLFGTSKTYRQVMPSILDSILSSNSFNCAVRSHFPLRSWNYLQYLNDNHVLSNKLLVIELAPLSMIGKNEALASTQFSLNADALKTMINYVSMLPISPEMKRKYLLNYARSAAIKYSGLSFMNTLNAVYQSHELALDPAIKSRLDSVGFVSAAFEYELAPTESMRLRKQSVGTMTTEDLRTFFRNNQLDSLPNHSQFSDKLLNLTNQLNHKNKVVFVIPPRQGPDAAIAVQHLKLALMQEGFHVLDFSDPSDFPELYTKEGSFDKFHLNDQGAITYSKLLAEKLKGLKD